MVLGTSGAGRGFEARSIALKDKHCAGVTALCVTASAAKRVADRGDLSTRVCPMQATFVAPRTGLEADAKGTTAQRVDLSENDFCLSRSGPRDCAVFTPVPSHPRERRVVGKGVYRVDKYGEGETDVSRALSAARPCRPRLL